MNTLQNATAIFALSAGLCVAGSRIYTELTLDFTEPTGTVQSSDTEIRATLSVVGDEAFSFDTNSTDEPIFRPAGHLLPEYGNNYSEGLFDVAFLIPTRGLPLFIGRSCTGSFHQWLQRRPILIAAATGANSWFEVAALHARAG